ncbi:MAG: signal peptidase I [Spirochaetaceae bacterium]|jgi:signal peptidase I|nr:signal peptidase I [Spirochaetaceae bacterium]
MKMRKNIDYSYQLRKELRARIKRIALALCGVIAGLLLILRFVIFPVRIQSFSMEPNISPNSLVFVTPLVGTRDELPVIKAVERGDVVLVYPSARSSSSFLMDVLDTTISFLTFRQVSLVNPRHLSSLSPAIVRIAGMPGDRVFMKNHILYVKPAGESRAATEFELSEKKYNTIVQPFPTDWDSALGVAGDFSEITLGGNQFFLLCDNRSTSMDSRIWGPVPADAILGKVWLRYFPLNRLTKF